MAKQFSEDEVQGIINDYENGIKLKDLGLKYNRSSSSILGKLKSLNIYKNTKYYYTNEDIEFLKTYYPIGDYDKIFERFPNVSKQRIQSVCSIHNIKIESHFWTDEEVQILRDKYSTHSVRELYDLLGGKRTVYAIKAKLEKLGIKSNRTSIWTSEELDILYRCYPTMPMSELTPLLPNKTFDAIQRKACSLSILSYTTLTTRWTDEEIQYLLDNWKTQTDSQIAEYLGRDKRSVSEKRWSLRLLRFGHLSDSKYEDLKKFLRGQLGEWKSLSMKSCDYKCVLTGSKDFQIHHLYSFGTIFSKIIEENNFNLKDNFSDYTDEELSFILEKFLIEHNKYGLGVCVRKDIHTLFHNIYGKINIPEQWEEFKRDYNNGKFNAELNLQTI